MTRGTLALAPRGRLAGAVPGGIRVVAGVINDARARQARHRDFGALVLLTVVLLAGLTIGGPSHKAGLARSPLAHAAQVTTPPAQVHWLMPCQGGHSTWWAPCP